MSWLLSNVRETANTLRARDAWDSAACVAVQISHYLPQPCQIARQDARHFGGMNQLFAALVPHHLYERRRVDGRRRCNLLAELHIVARRLFHLQSQQRTEDDHDRARRRLE